MYNMDDEYALYQCMLMVLQDISFAISEAKLDKDNYNKYKEGNIDDFSSDVLIGMKVLDILKRLGYPMDELGTYLYKDVIVEVYNSLLNVSSRRDIDECRFLLDQLNDCFSSFYFYIAREWKELGVKPFHLYIQHAIEKIDDNNIDKELSKSIYGDIVEEKNYGLNAFQIASYVSGKYSFNDTLNYQKPKIKKLSNTPDNIRLKKYFSECI